MRMSLRTVETKTAEKQQPQTPFGAPHVFVLVLCDSTNPRDVYRIAQRETIIGRSDDVDVPLDDESVSKRHCSIQVDGSVCSVTDLGSLNGTMLNDDLLTPEPRTLRDGDVITVSPVTITFVVSKQ